MPRSTPAKALHALEYLLLKGMRRASDRLEPRLIEGQLLEAGLHDVGPIHSFTENDELIALYYLASACRPGATVLEIGSYLGASTCYLAAGLRRNGGHLYCVDTWDNTTMPDGERDTYAEFERNTRGVADMITPVRKQSSELTESDLRLPVDLVFIDGDHDYEVVKSDLEIVQDWLADDGTIALHDVGDIFDGVSRAVGEALASGRWVLAGFVNSLAWIRPAPWDRSDPTEPS
jgi:predicted O-methyltransferase YrrM